jgi:hypothetical protein
VKACEASEEDDGICEALLVGQQSALIQIAFMRPANYTWVMVRVAKTLDEMRAFQNDQDGIYIETANHDSCWDEGLKIIENVATELRRAVITEKSSLVLGSYAIRPVTSTDLRSFFVATVNVDERDDRMRFLSFPG